MGLLHKLRTLTLDVRLATRSLARSRVFTLAVGCVLALGVGFATAIFVVFLRVVSPQLPYPDAARIVYLPRAPVEHSQTGVRVHDVVRIPQFTSVGLYQPGQANLGAGSRQTRVNLAVVDSSFFDVLGIEPTLGRYFHSSENHGARVAVVSQRFWETTGNSMILEGAEVRLNERVYSVIGIMPSTFDFPQGTAIWVPPHTDPQFVAPAYLPATLARISSNFSVEEVTSALEAAEIFKQGRPSRSPPAVPLHQLTARNLRPLVTGCGLLGVILLAATCTNLVGLWVSRLRRLHDELTIRSMLGATPVRLAFWAAVQPLVISVPAALTGLGIAAGAVHVLETMIPGLRVHSTAILDPRFWGVGLIVTTVTTFTCSMAPALLLQRTLRANPRAVSASLGRRRIFIGAVVVLQAAFAVLLVATAFTVSATLRRLMDVDLGLKAEHALFFDTTLPKDRYPARTDAARFVLRLEAELRRFTPEPIFVGATNLSLGPARILPALTISRIADRALDSGVTEASGLALTASPTYFDAAGIRLIAGRPFTSLDSDGALQVIILSESVARKVSSNAQSLIDQPVVLRKGSARQPALVIGVVSDVRLHGPAFPHIDAIYQPITQGAYAGTLSVVASSASGSGVTLESVREAVTAVDPTIPVFNVAVARDLKTQFVRDERLINALVMLFAIATTVLCGMGAFGVSALALAEKRLEIGIRLLLGSSPGGIRRIILATGLWLIGSGGLAGAIVAASALHKASFLIPTLEPPTAVIIAGSSLLILMAGGFASYIPSRWAATVNPLDVVRESQRESRV